MDVTVENLNPRSAPVRTLIASIKAAQAVEFLCEMVVEFNKGDYESARNDHPYWWVNHKDSPTGSAAAYREAVSGGLTQLPWGQWFDLWRDGTLREQIRDLAANLPAESRKKLGL